MSKIKIKYKINIVKDNFYTFNVLNTQILKKIFLFAYLTSALVTLLIFNYKACTEENSA
jgi:hypothetical protein